MDPPAPLIARNEHATVIDTITYKNLVPGKAYTAEGTLMDKATGEPLTDSAGNKVTASTEFTPETPSGTVEVTFTFDTSKLADSTEIVAFESIKRNGIEIAAHADLEDEAQTVTVAEPKLHTTATDKADGDKNVVIDPESSVNDVVAYENLVAGEEVTVQGILMNKQTGLPLLTGEEAPAVAEEDLKALWEDMLAAFGIPSPEKDAAADKEQDGTDQAGEEGQEAGQQEAAKPAFPAEPDFEALTKLMADHADIVKLMTMQEATFTPEASNGEVTIEFAFDSTKLEDTDTVVFEYMFKDSMLIAAHADIEDEGQTVSLVNSKIKTTATDKTDGDHVLLPSRNATVIDTVEYTGLIPGKEYTISGTLMDKATNSALIVGDTPVTAEKTFTPNHSDGTVELELSFDATALQGKAIVAFEHLYKDGIEVAAHTDIEDEAQTVVVTEEDTPGSTFGGTFGKTGVDLGWLAVAALAALAAAGALGTYAYRQRKGAASRKARKAKAE